ncbi:MAG TPA: zinc-dependent metalloprotease, partial [Jatrophihabitans sp.]|nr:zinc-dependent metalloprotease [Jatrophihabitans sp.]
RRRRGGNPLDRLLRRLLGMEAKTRQYVDGSAFVRTVVDRVGVPGFNAIWTSAETLPTKAEIADPGGWISRVHA